MLRTSGIDFAPEFDLNALCMGHITGNTANNNIIAFPDGFTAEAKALGADTETTANGFEVIRPLFTEPDMLFNIPAFEESEVIKNVVEKIRAESSATSKEKKVLLKLNGPYSVLASLISPELFYRWCAKYREAIHSALDSITASLEIYLDKSINAGAGIVSLADPYANVSVLGEKRYREFAAAYLLRLLRGVKEETAVIHLCPHSSIPLVQFGCFEAKDIPVNNDSYLDALVRQSGPLLLGNRCIYSGKTDSITSLICETFCTPLLTTW
jgi:uroporphyrinogen-III decarboxylase